MDDVIFAGTGARPARNHAEVTLTIETPRARAPARSTTTRCWRWPAGSTGATGSTYRINGREVRARDVQLLFADASTGANSPALVRQGQISELIAAKPQNRRADPGGGGRASRACTAAATRPSSGCARPRPTWPGWRTWTRELEASLARLRREARAAEKYKKLAAEIRRPAERRCCSPAGAGRGTPKRGRSEPREAALAQEQAARAAAAASAEALQAGEGLAPLREEEAIAAAVLQRRPCEKDRLDRDARAGRDADRAG